MSKVNVRTSGPNAETVTQYSIECPFCHASVIPNYLFFHDNKLFACCPNESCKHHFVLAKDSENKYVKVDTNAIPKSIVFSEIINTTSSSFASIYNQAYHAEQMGLDQICGVGYRKALGKKTKIYTLKQNLTYSIAFGVIIKSI